MDNLENKPAETKDQNTEQEEKQEVESPPKSQAVAELEDRESFLSKMKDKIFGSGKNSSQGTGMYSLQSKGEGKKEEVKKETKDETNKETKTLEEDISDDFTTTAKSQGWEDKDIVEFAKNYTNEELKQLIPFLTEKEVQKEEKKEEVKKEVKEEKVELKDNDLNAIVEKITKDLDAKYQKKFEDTEKKLQTYEQETKAKSVQSFQNTADKFFDDAIKDFPVFGTTKDLIRFPKGTPQGGSIVPNGKAYEARSAVYKTARAFYMTGESWDTSLKEALDWYKGKNMEKDIHSKLVRDLKANEKRLSPKRTEQKIQKKFSNPADERENTIKELASSVGIDT